MTAIERDRGVEPSPPEHDASAIDFDRILRGRVCIIGIGNRDRGDDAAGSLLAGSLDAATRAVVIDAGAVPENYLGKALRAAPDTIVLVDAVDFGALPGFVGLIERGRLDAVGLSTHALSLGMAVDYLSRQSSAEVIVIGIQPARLEQGSNLSTAVAGGVASLRRQLIACLGREPEPKETHHEHR